EDHRQRSDEMWGDGVHQSAAFDGGFPRNRHVGPGEVAQPAVGEFGTPTAGAGGEVTAFDEGDGQSPARGVEGDADAGEAAADDEDVGVTGSVAERRSRSRWAALSAESPEGPGASAAEVVESIPILSGTKSYQFAIAAQCCQDQDRKSVV